MEMINKTNPVSSFKKALIQVSLLWLGCFVLSMIFGIISSPSLEIIQELRLPRAILATAVGMGLSLSGATLQAVYSNPLCEPYLLGISSGAALGAVVGVTLGIEVSSFGVALPALLGALLFSLILQLGSSFTVRSGLSWILMGILLGSFGSSLVSIWMTVVEPSGVQNLLFWMLGDLSRARLTTSVLALTVTLFFSLLLWRRSKSLDAFLLGETGARSLGIETVQARRSFVWIAAVLVSVSVACSGMIGFIGLVVPHFARLRVGALHSRLLPYCGIVGAVAMLSADLIARLAFRPYELPVGAVTALLGAPCLVFMISKMRSF